MPYKSKLTKELLFEYYINQKKTIRWIAKELKVSAKTVTKNLKKYEILIRKNSERYSDRNLKDIEFFDLKVIGESGRNSRGRKLWKCECKCGNIVDLPAYVIIKKSAKTCGDRKNHYSDIHNPNWKGYEGLSKTFWYRIVNGAKARNLIIEINIEEAWELFLSQEGKCALSGLELTITLSDRTASLDRKDSTKGYTKDNVQWTHKLVNIMKQDMTDEEFIEFCHTISNYQKNKNESLQDNQ